jgi:hypothetical protein
MAAKSGSKLAGGIERPRNELQTKVLIAKESQTGQPSDLAIRCARVVQETSPHLNEAIVVNHDDVLRGKKRTAPVRPRLVRRITGAADDPRQP